MADVLDKKNATTQNDKIVKPEAKAEDISGDNLKTPKRFGLVEMILILLLAGIVFIYIFGMKQMKMEKAELARTQQLFEQVVPTFDKITKAAKAYQAKDEFAAYPVDISELFPPAEIDTKEFKFTISDAGIVTATTTKDFGKEGIKVNYNIGSKAYDISDPAPDTPPNILDTWLPEE